VNGYVKAVLRLEEIRRKREERCNRYVRPLDRKHDVLATEVDRRMRALIGTQPAEARRILAADQRGNDTIVERAYDTRGTGFREEHSGHARATGRCHHGRRRIAVPPSATPSAGTYPSLGIVGRHGPRLYRRYVSQRRRLPATRCRAHRAVPCDRGAPRRLPRDGQPPRGRRPAARLRGARVPRLPDLWGAGARLRAPAVPRLCAEAAGAVLVQGSWLLPELRRPAHRSPRRIWSTRCCHACPCASGC